MNCGPFRRERGKVILLSSYAKKKEYAQNFLSLLALPPGAEVVYRYSAQLIAQNLRARISPALDRKFFRNARVLFGHVANINGEFRYIPCRFGTLIGSPQVIHSIFQFRVQLGSYAFVEGARQASWLDEIRRLTDGGMNFREGAGEDGELVTFCDGENLPPVETSEDCWDDLVKEFAEAPIFADHKVFFRIAEIRRLGSGKRASLEKGVLELAPNTSYEVLFVHKDLTGQHEGGHFQVTASSEHLYAISNPQINILSPYDISQVILRTGVPLQRDEGYMTLSVYEDASDGTPKWSDDLRFSIHGALTLKILLGVTVGVLLWISGSGVMDVVQGTKDPSGAELLKLGVALLATIAAAMLVIFNFKKLP